MLVPEEQLTHLTNVSGEPEKISNERIWCIFRFLAEEGFFGWFNHFLWFSRTINSNNISRILENVVKILPVKLKEERLEFDYVVIGAGSAGCVVANRLASSERFSIAL